MAFISFPPRQPFASTRLPLTLMTLDEWALATITGVDSEKYIQGQVTADVSQMTEHQHVLAAHCDAKGKMWSNLRLFRQGDGFAWLERRSLRDAQLTELKKYAVFSKAGALPRTTSAYCWASRDSRRAQRWPISLANYQTAISRSLLKVLPPYCGSNIPLSVSC